MTLLRVFVTDRDPYASRALTQALAQDADLVVSAYASEEDLVAEVASHPPDVVLVDEDDDGRLVGDVRAASPRTAILVLAHDDDDAAALDALRRGADGFLSKRVDLAVLPRVVRALGRGEVVITRRLTRRLVEELRTPTSGVLGVRPVRSTLSDREWEVLDLLRTGSTTPEVAQALGVSQATVRSHVKHVLRKLHARSRDEAVTTAEHLIHSALR